MVKTHEHGGADRDRPRATCRVSNVVAYLVDWNVTDVERHARSSFAGATREVVTAALDNMTGEGYDEISRRHQEAHRRARGAKKNPEYRARVASDLRICRLMHWTYDDVLNLPADVYDVLVEDLTKEAEAAADGPDREIPR